jgi:hypothetical protein
MGTRTEDRRPLAWQASLREMKAYGTLLAQTASCACPGRWVELDLDQLLAKHGGDYRLWDRRPACSSCGRPGHYMASPGESTPYRPLLSGPRHDAERKAFLLGFGFTRRDVARIKAMAEKVTTNHCPAALNDLDVPYRVGACWPGDERHHSGRVLGEWAGRTLLYWEMAGVERDHWARRRRGPRPV